VEALGRAKELAAGKGRLVAPAPDGQLEVTVLDGFGGFLPRNRTGSDVVAESIHLGDGVLRRTCEVRELCRELKFGGDGLAIFIGPFAIRILGIADAFEQLGSTIRIKGV